MILIKPFITDKSSMNEEKSCYTFSVCIKSNKNQIKKEIDKVFGVSTKKIRTMIYPRKDKSKYTKKGFLYGKTIRLKKAIIQLKENQKIDFLNQKNI
ncbi:50S ribosomal protein L23 [Blattabacterium sp. (Cryptocercus kyebangensis)]|uniref:50S ribosomal protein L23 n=1 Tax=Blattabacterium sp. (Cryptocercus kyebangensis) TaxID=298656 RepID=UPI000D7C841B|nr:50S ribosomal protein L23 [Blattabacterium sp. (Cryptocercus kyebangensis)]AWU43677.1 50S ribosomal protein L23 [Blattabacterium sp. (Cryptocercus kyebangensis)]